MSSESEVKEQVFDVISLFTLGVNMNCSKYGDMIFNNSSKNVVSVENVSLGYDVVKVGEDLYQVNLNIGSKYVNVDGESVLELAITQAGIFRIVAGDESVDDFVELAINVNAPGILYPHIRPLYNMLIAQNGIKPHPLGTVDFYKTYSDSKISKSKEKS